MQPNKDLEALCSELGDSRPQWGRILAHFKNHPKFDAGKKIPFENYMSYFVAIHLGTALDSLAQAHPEYKIKFHVVSKNSITPSCRFSCDYASRVFAHKKQGFPSSLASYDCVVKVGPLPVAFDLRGGKIEKKDFLKLIRSSSKMAYLNEYFGQESGYVMVLPRDAYERFKDRKAGHNFTTNCGLLVPLYATRDDFQSEIKEVLDRAKLKY